jgi:hypothetical protein
MSDVWAKTDIAHGQPATNCNDSRPKRIPIAGVVFSQWIDIQIPRCGAEEIDFRVAAFKGSRNFIDPPFKR